MKKITVFALAAGIMLSAEAPAPHDTGLIIPTAQSGQVLTDCIKKKMGGNVIDEKPIGDHGVSIETIKYPNSIFMGHPTLYFDITEAGDNRQINIHYRHPMSKGAAAKWTRIIGRKCFPYELEAAGGGTLPDTDG
jgi:hypothetical protein